MCAFLLLSLLLRGSIINRKAVLSRVQRLSATDVPSLGILDLPRDFLVDVLSALTARERVCFVSTCSKARELGHSCPWLWETAAAFFYGPEARQIAQLADWVQSNGACIRRFGFMALFNYNANAARACSRLLCSLANASNASLLSLFWYSSGYSLSSRLLASALPKLRGLRFLELAGDTYEGVPNLSCLTALECLRLRGWYRALSYVPSSLRVLQLPLDAHEIPRAVLSATQVRRLELSYARQNWEQLGLNGLGWSLTGLTYLSLRACGLRQQLPMDELRPLAPSLLVLDLSDNLGLGTQSVDFALLTNLRKLRELDLSDCLLEQFPKDLLRMPHLKFLSVSGLEPVFGESLQQLGGNFSSSSLRAVGINVSAARPSALAGALEGLLDVMPCVTHLHLAGFPLPWHFAVWTRSMQQITRCANAVEQLRVLSFEANNPVLPGAERVGEREQEARAELERAFERAEVRWGQEFKLPSAARDVSWQDVK